MYYELRRHIYSHICAVCVCVYTHIFLDYVPICANICRYIQQSILEGNALKC